jgi:hypothetical protein
MSLIDEPNVPDQGREMVCNLYEQSASLIRRALIH